MKLGRNKVEAHGTQGDNTSRDSRGGISPLPLPA
jgi:hypothetical protein